MKKYVFNNYNIEAVCEYILEEIEECKINNGTYIQGAIMYDKRLEGFFYTDINKVDYFNSKCGDTIYKVIEIDITKNHTEKTIKKIAFNI